MFCDVPDRCMVRWTESRNTNVEDGILLRSRELRECQSICVDTVNCTGVDWVLDAPSGQQCYLAGYWSGDRNEDTSGVDHYDIVRPPADCPRKYINE